MKFKFKAKRKILVPIAAFVAWTVTSSFIAPDAMAGRFEVSSGFSYSRTDYGNSNYSWTRRWAGSFGYHFSERSEIEVSIQDVVDRTLIHGYQDTTTHDQIYSLSWVQSMLGKGYLIDPYVKVGAGQLNRDASGTYAFGGSPASQVDSLTVLLGAGIRFNITKGFGIRTEVNSYLTGGSISTYRDNVSYNAGVSFYF